MGWRGVSGTIQTPQNLPGSLSYLLDKTGEKYGAEYILIDLNPSLSSINQNFVMTSDYFIVPASPDYFSVMAIDSLTCVFPRWRAWAQQASSMSVFRDATYPLPTTVPKFLGTIIQKYRIRVQAGHDDDDLGRRRAARLPRDSRSGSTRSTQPCGGNSYRCYAEGDDARRSQISRA